MQIKNTLRNVFMAVAVGLGFGSCTPLLVPVTQPNPYRYNPYNRTPRVYIIMPRPQFNYYSPRTYYYRPNYYRPNNRNYNQPHYQRPRGRGH